MIPADWHPDPTGKHELRYWDGTQWTEHVADAGVQGVDPLDAGPAAGSGEQAVVQQEQQVSADAAQYGVEADLGPDAATRVAPHRQDLLNQVRAEASAPAAELESTGVASECNGSARLCTRRLDQVVFAGAHNAMSNAEVSGWLFPHHNHGIARQLEDGVRALLIDVHYGVPAGEHVITDFDREGGSIDKIQGALGPEATQAALRIRNRFLGRETGPSDIYFCHGFCELGAYPVGPTLQAVREFMVANPGEVVVIVIEDYIPPEAIAQLFQEAGMLELIFTGSLTRPVPTLREMIDWGQRLVLFIESGKPGVPWLRPAWETMQETPYTFHKPEDFSCRPNRGPATAPFFQINHWIETTPAPRPSNAEIVNAYDLLLRRARACREERNRLPNIVAVDFYSVGDLFRVVRTLNGVDERGTVARAQ